MFIEVLTYLKNLFNNTDQTDQSDQFDQTKQTKSYYAKRIAIFMFLYSFVLAIEEILLGYFILNETFGTKYLILLTSGLNLLVDLFWSQKETYVNDGSDYILSRQNEILINKLTNTDYAEIDKCDKLKLSANMGMLRIIYETLTTYAEYLISFIVGISVAMGYNLLIGNYYVVFSLVIFILITGLAYKYAYKGLENKLVLSESSNIELSARTSEFYQDIFNISINSDTSNIDNYKTEYDKTNKSNVSYMHSKSNSDTIFIVIVGIGFYIIHFFNPNINTSVIIGLIGVFRSLYQILYNSADLQNKVNVIMPNIKYINELYQLKPRPTITQIKLKSTDKILITNLNISKPYLKLKLSNPIELEPNNIYWISGKSGCGKSTFVKIFRGIIDLNAESENVIINVADKEITNFNSISSNIYYVGQNNKLYRSANIYDLISGYKSTVQTSDNQLTKSTVDTSIETKDKARIDKLLKISDIEYLKNSEIINPHNLSGGELLRVSLCKTLFQCKKKKLKIIIMDEIDAGLDTNISKKIYEYIKNNFKRSIILVISHKDILNELNLSKIKIVDNQIHFIKS